MTKQDCFFVTDELQRVLDSLPEDSPRSKLEPFRAFILRWRREGRSYDRICQILRDQCHVNVAHATLFEFVKLRSRPRKSKPGIELGSELPPSALGQTLPTAGNVRRLNPEERAAQVEFIRSLNKPEVVMEKPKPLFDPDLSKPRTKFKQQGD